MAIKIQSINADNKTDELVKFFHPQKYLFKYGDNSVDIEDMLQIDGGILTIETEGPTIESILQRIIPLLPQGLKALAIIVRVTQSKPIEVVQQIAHIIKWIGKIPCRIKVTWGVEPVENQIENFKITLLVVSNKENNQNQTLK